MQGGIFDRQSSICDKMYEVLGIVSEFSISFKIWYGDSNKKYNTKTIYFTVVVCIDV
jgi:hypothetical protein